INIVNSGTVTGTGALGKALVPVNINSTSVAIAAATLGASSDVVIDNMGDVKGNGKFGVGIVAFTYGAGSKNLITNSGNAYGGYAAILSGSRTATTIVNSGDIAAKSNFAIGVYGGPATIYNSGHITGFVRLDADDRFFNEKGGV